MVKVPRVAGGTAIDGGFGRRSDPALGAGGAAKGNDPGRPDAFINRRIAPIACVGQKAAAVVTGKVHRFAAQILQQERHAAKGALGQAIGNGLARNTFLHLHNRVDRGVSGSDGSKRCVQEFARADLATGHAFGQFGCVFCTQITDHRSSPIAVLLEPSLTGSAGPVHPARALTRVGFRPLRLIATFPPARATWGQSGA